MTTTRPRCRKPYRICMWLTEDGYTLYYLGHEGHEWVDHLNPRYRDMTFPGTAAGPVDAIYGQPLSGEPTLVGAAKRALALGFPPPRL